MLTRKDIFMALADDEEFEIMVDDTRPDEWVDFTTEKLLDYLSKYPTAQTFPHIRAKSKTITKTVTFPAPLKTAPTVGTKYYYVKSYGVEIYYWNNDEVDNAFLEIGGVHLSEENAEKHYKAIQAVKCPFSS